MLNLRKLLQFIFVFGIITIFYRHETRIRAEIKYGAILTLERVLNDYDFFKKCMRFTPMVWYHEFYSKIESYLNQPNDYHLFPNAGDHRERERNLSKVLRVMRFNLSFTACNISTLELLFGQSRWTIERDRDFIVEVVIKVMYYEHIYLAIPGSGEYAEWVGMGVFNLYFRTSIYAMDIVKFKIKCPYCNQRDYYDGHHCEHNVGVGVVCNGHGVPCLISDAYPGRISDLTIWNEMCQHSNILRLILPGHYILADRMFRFCAPPLLTAYTGYMILTLHQLYFNYFQSSARIIVENLFSRVKCYWPIFYYFPWSLSKINIYIKCAFVMTSILIKYQEPLRAEE